MANKKFNFIEAYRTLLPTTAREIVDARQKGYEKLFPTCSSSRERIYELCRLALQIPQDSNLLIEWFEKPIKEFDPQFVVTVDKAEASRIASLLLRDLISGGNSMAALAALASSFCGSRSPLDSELLVGARDAIAEVGRNRRIIAAEKKIVAPAGSDLKAQLDAIQSELNPTTVRAGVQAVIADVRVGLSSVATSASDAHASLRNDVMLLAEEVDMLWWYVGDWIEILQKPRSSLPEGAVAISIGAEIGNLVRQMPGPYGVYGILRRSLAKNSDRKAKLQDVVGAIEHDDIKKLALDLPTSQTSQPHEGEAQPRCR